ncbi:MAG: hypothetical protein J3R72DRAFT_415852 [Linnemannia gamsii]|nr:MAG: hypothetical protein J3R72DRAFT_415852 [Linnemannia gamsii]
MSTITLRRLRIWMLLLTFINGLVMVAFYGYSFFIWTISQPYHLVPNLQPYDLPTNYLIAPLPSSSSTLPQSRQQLFSFFWKEWANIITAGVLFLIYILALVTLPFQLQKYLRALLVAAPMVLSLYVNIEYVVRVMSFTSVRSPLQCLSTNTMCYLTWSSRFMAIITGAFVAIEIVLTLVWGPLRRREEERGVRNAEDEREEEEEEEDKGEVIDVEEEKEDKGEVIDVEGPQSVDSRGLPPPQPHGDDSGAGIGSGSNSSNSQPQMTQV